MDMMLKEWFEKHKVKQVALAKALGYHQQHISQITRGLRRPSKRLAREIEAFTNGEVTIDDLRAIDI